ncbi:ribosome small subunit-dependent GTPase A [Ferroacidibacillus organovorans]|uniref:Small ribosomal subunit biogenesis GTPase RsgA n=1 Tax=Ferroacidibacillus organovorans TaxID=1765683 RepID=A0A162S6N2_9BACL|nr:ribosome small subunit-dependent GTPase A [Ferroacidibacillus organovorans]KYP79571.1 ribosome small subunit-dependent GTPase [Ferroacidibacillus organovorans]OPG17523.1 ribosome small subunit-dependent GTPase A [Ferroacidibacillus organovorans]
MRQAQYGWNSAWESKFAVYADQDMIAARVLSEAQGLYRVAFEEGECFAEVSGRLRHGALGREDYPAVGDFVAISGGNQYDHAVIHAILERSSCLRRKAAGNVQDAQVIAANVDVLFLVNAANDVNIRRIERYLIVAWESGAIPVIVLSKADLANDVERLLADVENVAPGVAVHAVSVAQQVGLEPLNDYLKSGVTASLIGSSGAGKSTLVNHWMNADVQHVQAVREEDGRGRHTTTQRTLFALPTNAFVIDTPGMRELQLWDSDEGVEDAFGDLETMAKTCAFRDCSHVSEPGCAIQQAIANGDVSAARFLNYRKMLRELAYVARKEDRQAQAQEREKWKKITKSARQKVRW